MGTEQKNIREAEHDGGTVLARDYSTEISPGLLDLFAILHVNYWGGRHSARVQAAEQKNREEPKMPNLIYLRIWIIIYILIIL